MALNLSGTSGVTGAGIGTIGPSGANITGVVTCTSVVSSGALSLGTGTTIHAAANNELALGTNGVERVRIDDTGRVGIGTNNPHVTGLTVSGANARFQLISPTTGGGSGDGVIFGLNGDQDFFINNRETSKNILFFTEGSERLRIASNALITATQPNSAIGLIVKNTAHNSQLQILATASNKNSEIWFGDAGDDDIGKIDYDHNNNSLAFTANTTERLKINSDGSINLSVSGVEADILHSGSGDRWPLRLLNSDTTSGNMTGIYFGPCNNVAGAYISGKAEADFTSTANRDAGLEFGTRLDGNWKIPMAISAAGYVTKPLHPAFKAGRSTNYLCGAGDAIVFNDTSTTAAGHFNDGGHYNASNGQFTAPVAGIYFFYALVIYMSISDDTDMTDCFDIYRNASDHIAFSSRRAKYRDNYTGTSAYFTDTSTVVCKLAADDYVWIKNKRELNVHGNTRYCYFCGHLIG